MAGGGKGKRGQKLRVACALEAKRVGVPAVKRRPARGTLNHATIGAPAARRHMEQWQMVALNGTPSAV